MANRSSSPSSELLHPSPPFPVFVDTNLDTRFAFNVFPEDTVANLKQKVRTEHVLCFPDIGEVSVKAVKVKRRGSLYHLLDSMFVMRAFSEITRAGFLHLDLEPTTSILNCQTEATNTIMNESHQEPKVNNLLQIDRNTSLVPVGGEDRDESLVANEMSIEKGPVQTSMENDHERERTPDNLLKEPSAKEVHVLSSELDIRPDTGIREMELVTVGDAMVGSNHQKESMKVAAEDRKRDNHGDGGIGPDENVRVIASKKEKSRKRSSALQSDQFLDGKSEHPYAEKKKRKKDESFKEPVKDQLTELNLKNTVYKKETDQSSSEGFLTDSSLHQNPIDGKQKNQKKKKSLPENDEPQQDESVDNSIRNTDAALGEQAAEENHVEHTETLPSPSIELPTQEFSNTNPEVPLQKNAEALGKESNVAAIYEESIQPINRDGVDLEVAANPIEKDGDALVSSEKPVNKEKIDEVLRNSHDKFGKVSDVVMNDIQLSNKNVKESGIPSEVNVKSSKRSRKKKGEKTELSNTSSAVLETVNSSKDQVAEENQNKMLSIPEEYPGENFKAENVTGDAAASGYSVPVESKLPCSPSDKKKKRKQKKAEKFELHQQEPKLQSSTHEILNSPRNQVVEKLMEEQSVRNPGDESKEETVLGEAVANFKTAEAIIPSNTNDKKSKRSRKKTEKSVNFVVDKVIEENLKESLEDNNKDTSGRHLEHPAKGHEETTIYGNAKVDANMSILDSEVPLRPSDKESKRRKKKAENNELPNKESKDDTGHTLTRDHTSKNLEKVLGITSKGSGLSGFDDSSDKNETRHLSAQNTTEENTTGLQKAHEASDVKNVEHAIGKESTESIQENDNRELPKSDSGKIDFLKVFDPEARQLEMTQELPSVETETKKINKEKTKRKKKLNPSPQEPTAKWLRPLDSDKQHISRKKPQEKDSGKPNLIQIPEELLFSKKHKQKTADFVHKSDVGSPRSSKDDHKSKNFDASIRNSPGGGPVTQNSFHAVGRVPAEETMDDLAASSDSTKEDTPVIKKRYRVAVRKVPSSRYQKVPDKLNEEKTLLSASAKIFDDASSGSSEEEFEVSNRQALEKATPDNSSTSDESDGSIEDTQISYKDSSEAESDHHKGEKGSKAAKSNLTQKPNVKRKGKPISTILKSTRSYKKAKRITASQSELDESESQQLDVVPETQPDSL
ncbi:enolase-phosphatase E1-like isoform X2 [Asparagus officinalis]|uniref:enolase-phosphatase E1-like isoform X2 n=1 Tax=Asparagus officinalis TaxID=4686 RepID=UPI00098E2D44|nr:enolase-phosphatase E1-like isoform X2 [Asparagus officinalis]